MPAEPPILKARPVDVGTLVKTNPGIEAEPPAVVTVTLPDAPDAITADIVVAFTTVNEDDETPPKLTAVAPVKFVPVMVTVVPAPAVVGVKEERVGAGVAGGGTTAVSFLQAVIATKKERIQMSSI